MEHELTLIYFNARGLAETSRLLLALAQIEYTDKSYYSTSGTWSLKDNNKYLELNESGTIELFRIRELRKGKMSIEGDFDGKAKGKTKK